MKYKILDKIEKIIDSDSFLIITMFIVCYIVGYVILGGLQ